MENFFDVFLTVLELFFSPSVSIYEMIMKNFSINDIHLLVSVLTGLSALFLVFGNPQRPFQNAGFSGAGLVALGLMVIIQIASKDTFYNTYIIISIIFTKLVLIVGALLLGRWGARNIVLFLSASVLAFIVAFLLNSNSELPVFLSIILVLTSSYQAAKTVYESRIDYSQAVFSGVFLLSLIGGFTEFQFLQTNNSYNKILIMWWENLYGISIIVGFLQGLRIRFISNRSLLNWLI